MDNSTINLIFTVVFVLGIIIIFIILLNAPSEKIKKMVEDADKKRSDAIKRGIKNSKIYGTKKSRRSKNF